MKNILALSFLSLVISANVSASATTPTEAVSECVSAFKYLSQYAPVCGGVKTSDHVKLVKECMKTYDDLVVYIPACQGLRTLNDLKEVRICMKNFNNIGAYAGACKGVFEKDKVTATSEDDGNN